MAGEQAAHSRWQSQKEDTMIQTTTTERVSLPAMTLREAIGVVVDVILPNLAKGVIIRRPKMVALAERLKLDQRAVRRMQWLRDKYKIGPVALRMPIHSYTLILAPAHVGKVLDGTPEPFTSASGEKRAALSHFEPKGVLNLARF